MARRAARNDTEVMRWVAGLAAVSLLLPAARAQEAKEILEKVAGTYQGLSSCHFEWTTVAETRTEAATSSQETRYELAAAKPNKIKALVGYPNHETWIRVSDGNTLTRYRSYGHQVSREPAPADLGGILNSTLIGDYERIADRVQSARITGSEAVNIGGTNIDCYVLEVEYPPGTLLPGTEPMPTRYWIDKSRFVVLREVSGTRSTGQFPTENTRTSTFTVAEINQPAPESAFEAPDR